MGAGLGLGLLGVGVGGRAGTPRHVPVRPGGHGHSRSSIRESRAALVALLAQQRERRMAGRGSAGALAVGQQETSTTRVDIIGEADANRYGQGDRRAYGR